MKKQIHAYYIGKVQGVGFRYTVRDIALGLGIYGWVKNLGDGRVEISAQAEEAALNDFTAMISRYFSRYIQNTEVQWQPASAEFKDFTIQF